MIGANPALKGRFSHFFRLQWATSTIETACRLRLPRNRDIRVTHKGAAPEPEDVLEDEVRTLRWRLVDASPYIYDSDTPAWWTGHAQVHVADCMSWADVADLFRHAYAPPAELPPDLDEDIARLADQFPNPADRTAAALLFVQRLLRYHSIGVGAGGFQPRPIADIWSSRYGDCKDASGLLAVILNRLDVEACPALVNTRSGHGLNEEAPHATAFDHCIVRAVVDGRAWWLDPTRAPQTGALAHLTPASFGWGLPLTADATLEVIPEQHRKVVLETQEIWTFGQAANDPARLAMRSIYRSWRADDMRRWRENEGSQSVSRRLREGLEINYGELVESRPMDWVDHSVTNELELAEDYIVGRPYAVNEGGDAGVRFESRDDIVDATFQTRERARRDQPIHIGAPRILRTERIFHFPVRPQITPWRTVLEGPGVRAINEFVWVNDKHARHVLEIDVEKSMVSVEAVQEYFIFLRSLRAANGVRFTLDTQQGRLKGVSAGLTTWTSWVWVLGGLILLGALRYLLSL